MTLEVDGPLVFEMDVRGYDERIAMVLCRLLKRPDGTALFTHQRIADAFGKNSRQDVHNHMQRLERVGGSIAAFADERRGRPSTVHPEMQELLAQRWERHPLDTLEETLDWLDKQPLPPEVVRPTREHLEDLRCVEGNLILARNALRRQMSRDGEQAALKLPVAFDRLLEVIDEQDRRLQQAGLCSPPLPQLAKDALEARNTPAVSRSARALVATLQGLCTTPTADVALVADLGPKALAPLHDGALYCVLRLSIGQVAALCARSKSVVYRGLTRLARAIEALDPFPPAPRFSGILGLDEKWIRISKSFSAEERSTSHRAGWRYAHFAVDAKTGDLLHVDVFERSDAQSIRAFLCALRAKGIRPKVVVTDMLAAYQQAIEDTFGDKVLLHFCRFHHLQAVRHWMRRTFGPRWKEEPLLCRLVDHIDFIYHCKTQRTARKRLLRALDLRSELQTHHPDAVALLDLLEQRFPLVANDIGRDDVPSTNNLTERTIKAFHRHYRGMAGFESIETARVQMTLFRFFYRMTPWPDAINPDDRGKCPLERAGWQIRGIPVADYVRRFTDPEDPDDPHCESPDTRPARPTSDA